MLTGVSPLSKLKPKRRWLQFSLRTAFLLVSVVCVGLSLWVVPAERQRRAVAALEALGGEISYVDNQAASESFITTFLRRRLPQVYFDEVVVVDLSGTQVTDAGLVRLQGLTGLKVLFLDNTQITDAGLAHLPSLTGLQMLELNNTQVTDAGLAHLQGLTGLQDLSLGNTQVTDTGLAHLQGLTGLQWLVLYNTQVTDAGLTQLRKALPTCRINGL